MKILSISDVITNSSSEVFVIHAKPEFQDEINEEIPEFLKELCSLFGEDIENIIECHISDSTYIDDGWYYYVNNNDLILRSTEENSIPYWLMDLIGDIPYIKKFQDKFSGNYAKDLGEQVLPYYDWNHDPNEPGLKYHKVPIKSIQRVHLG